MLYVDDCLIFPKHKDAADEPIEQLRNTFVFIDEGSVSTYLGIQVEMDKKENKMKSKQSFLVERIIEALNYNEYITGKETPVIPNDILHKNIEGPERKREWHYIGMLNFLSASTRPQIFFAVNQCTRFRNTPKLSHE